MPFSPDTLSPSFRVGSHVIGGSNPTFFIAEIGNNHNGDYFIAKRLVEESVASGASAVKLQKRFVNEVFTRELLDTPQTKDQVYGKTYGEYRERLELGMDDFLRLKEHAEALGSVFFATPFDLSSVDFLEKVGVEVYKIASFDVTNIPLLEKVASRKKPVFLSSGMCTIEELDEAVEVITRTNPNLAILHCVSVYPTPDEKLNLSTIPMLIRRYAPLPIGYSGHERDILPSVTAVALGARVIERHITLDKKMPGPDHGTVSIEPEEFRAMVDHARRVEAGLGSGSKAFLPDEQKVRGKHGKSVTSRVAIPSGTVVTSEMLTCKSPGSGLKPALLPSLIGKRALRDIPADHTVVADDIG